MENLETTDSLEVKDYKPIYHLQMTPKKATVVVSIIKVNLKTRTII